ncbi:hypothetical protein [Vibrio taketomensis]|uniref:hypothetical protein n=1 Tax=Vibrio taketomensis TaxID=2572923 RepID=UPI0015822CB7|nr:hypothetical protein [Vibrio taketomensis]
MRAPYTLLPGVTLRKYQLIRDKYYPDVVLPDYENTEEDEELEPEMKIQLDEISCQKKSHLPKISVTFLFAVRRLAVYFFQSAFADEEVIVETPATEVVTQAAKLTQDTKQVLVPSVPDYLQGVYISGYVLWRKDDGSLTYDYALHDRYHRSFDYSYYAITVTPTSLPCLVNYSG